MCSFNVSGDLKASIIETMSPLAEAACFNSLSCGNGHISKIEETKYCCGSYVRSPYRARPISIFPVVESFLLLLLRFISFRSVRECKEYRGRGNRWSTNRKGLLSIDSPHTPSPYTKWTPHGIRNVGLSFFFLSFHFVFFGLSKLEERSQLSILGAPCCFRLFRFEPIAMRTPALLPG